MGAQTLQTMRGGVWALAREQHDVISLWQLLALAFTRKAVRHRVEKGRLHPIFRGVYAVGTPNTTRFGFLIAAVLACGQGAALSHESAAELWGIRRREGGPVHVAVPGTSCRRHEGIVVHRRLGLVTTKRHGIPVTTIADTLIDLAASLSRDHLEAAINQADHLDLISPGQLGEALDQPSPRPGVRTLKRLIDIHTFVATTTWLERHFRPSPAAPVSPTSRDRRK